MRSRSEISRRRMLELAGAASGLAIVGGAHDARAQAKTRIDQYAPELDKIVTTSEPILELTSGLPGNTEGPVWWKDGGYLLFSDIGNDRRLKFAPGQGISVHKTPTNGGNGLTRDLQGRLITCEGLARRVMREERDGSITVIANNFQGRRLNKPNDVVVKSDGAIYFTDPWNIIPVPEQWDLQFNGLYRVSPDLGSITLLIDHFVIPNGLAFSPDESVLYVNDSRRRRIFAFDMLPNGLLAKQTERLFADVSGPETGGPDGMKVDTAGNVYCGGAGGIWIIDPKGKKLGRIVHGEANTTNIAFGGDDWKTLYFTTRHTLGSVKLKIAGLPVPAQKPQKT
jgi:gluconolactonase